MNRKDFKPAFMTLAILACASGAFTGCADTYAGPPVAYADVDFSGYYDGYYGPFAGGYWGPRGVFFYSDGHRFHRDSGRHFRRNAEPGFRPFQGHAPPAVRRPDAQRRP